MELKGRRELFCREYLKDLNGTQAAIRAAYSPDSARQTACDLLAEPEVQDRIAELAAARNEKLEIDATEVLLELLRMLRSDLAQALNDDGTLKPIHEIPIDCRRMIASVKVQETFDGSGEERVWTGYLKEVKFWNKERGAEMLARHLSLFNDKLKLDSGDLAAALAAARGRSESLV